MRSHSTANATPPTETLTGIVERITFHSEESGYTVARLKLPKTDNLTTIIGKPTSKQDLRFKLPDTGAIIPSTARTRSREVKS